MTPTMPPTMPTTNPTTTPTVPAMPTPGDIVARLDAIDDRLLMIADMFVRLAETLARRAEDGDGGPRECWDVGRPTSYPE